MPIDRRHLMTGTSLLVGLMVASPVPAAIKCWTNSEGVRECGNVIPPEYAQQEAEVKDKFGLTVKKRERAKTIEELEAERAEAKRRQEEALAAKKRAARDRVLLDTFASEDDLVLTRDGQIAHLESQVKLTRSHIEKLQNNLNQMIDRAAEFERRGENPSPEMLSNIESVRKQIAENEAFIRTKRKEQEDIRKRFAADIERFRELKAHR